MSLEFQPNVFKIAAQATADLVASGDVLIPEQIGVPNGVAGLDANGDIVATPIQRVDTAANLAAIVLKNGELAIASDTGDILRGNGLTASGLLVQGGVRTYTVAPTELTSTSSLGPLTVNVPLSIGTYRWWGVAGFSGDSDNQSNFAIACGDTTAAVADTSQSTQTGSAGGTFSWRLSKSTPFEAPEVRDWWPLSFASFAQFTATPPTTNVAAGRCYFDFWLPITVAHTRPFSIRLRAAKIGTPTIMGSYRLFVQRIA